VSRESPAVKVLTVAVLASRVGYGAAPLLTAMVAALSGE
jgi:hypothetical protein